MKNFLYIINKHSDKKIERERIITLIDQLKSCKHKHDYFDFDSVQCITYTNEPISLDSHKGDFFFSFNGQLIQSSIEIEENIYKLGPDRAKEYIKNLPGAHAISFAHIPSKTVRAFTHFSRVNPIYLFENEERIVLGLDPLIVNCIGSNSTKPIFNIDQSISFLIQGYFSDNQTLFKGVQAVPENSEICIKNNSIIISKVDDSISRMFTKKPTDEDYDQLTDLYLKSFDVVPQSDKPYNLGLTGGKDSRLLTLGTLENSIPFKANTRGFNDHPDVVIAKEIADKLNLEHTVKNPELNKEKNLEIDLVEKILKVMIGTSGTVYGYENIGFITEFKNKIGLTGVGAESIRGGYNNLKKKESKHIEEELVNSFFPLKSYIRPEKQNMYKEFLYNLGKGEDSFKEVQNKHFLFYRNGRWSGGTRSSLSYSSNVYSPFFDNNFLKSALELDINTLVNERLHYNIMKRLKPEIANMPFFESRWQFEEKGPSNPNDFYEWLKRNPVYSKTKIGAYNWRLIKNEDDTLRNAFRKILLSDPSHEIFSLVEYTQIDSILKGPAPVKLNKLIWSLASLKIYMDYYSNNQEYGFSKLSLKIPDSKIVNTEKYPVIKDLTKITKPINNAVKIEENNQQFDLIIKDKFFKKPYIQTGDRDFSTPSENFKENLNIEGYKKLYVRFCLENQSKDCNYQFSIMFYNESNRVKKKSLNYITKANRLYLEKEIQIPKQSKYVKFAIKFEPKKKKSEPQITLKYGYMRLI